MSQSLPLRHVKILDLTTLMAGPLATLYLAHMGAQVIKIEPLVTGDSGRNYGSDASLNAIYMGSIFMGLNAGKQSLALNLKTDEGVAIFKQLVSECDVVVENFRAGVMDKLGLGFETLKSINSKIVYCAISGYGQKGEMSNRAAYDQIVQGISGLMATTGEPAKDGELSTPYRVGVPIADALGALNGAIAIAGALNDPDKQAIYLDISMLDSTIMSMGWAVTECTISGNSPEQCGNHNPISCPSGSFRTKDGMINISTNTEQQWTDLAECLGHPEWVDQDIFKDRNSRRANRDTLIELMEAVLVNKTTDEWVPIIAPYKIPVGEIYNLKQALELNQVVDRGLLQNVHIEEIGRTIKIAKPPIMMNNENPDFTHPPESLSKSADKILQQILDMDEQQIADLRNNKIIG